MDSLRARQVLKDTHLQETSQPIQAPGFAPTAVGCAVIRRGDVVSYGCGQVPGCFSADQQSGCTHASDFDPDFFSRLHRLALHAHTREGGDQGAQEYLIDGSHGGQSRRKLCILGWRWDADI